MKLSPLLHQFFDQYLPHIKGVSPYTLNAYRDTFKLFIPHAAAHYGIKVTSLRVQHLTSELILSFLDHLQKQRNKTIIFVSHDLDGLTFDIRAHESVRADCVIPQMNISPGTYRLNLLIRKRDREEADRVDQAVSFEVVPADVYGTGRIPRGRSLIFLDG